MTQPKAIDPLEEIRQRLVQWLQQSPSVLVFAFHRDGNGLFWSSTTMLPDSWEQGDAEKIGGTILSELRRIEELERMKKRVNELGDAAPGNGSRHLRSV